METVEDFCPAGWPAKDIHEICNYTGGHYCVREPGHKPPHRCECGVKTIRKDAMPSEDEDG